LGELSNSDLFANEPARIMKPRLPADCPAVLPEARPYRMKQSSRSKRQPIFTPKSVLADIGKGKTHTAYAKDQKVYTQGDKAHAIFYIQRGKVKLTAVSKRGKEAVIAVLGGGDFFGEGCLAGRPLRISTVTTITECAIVRIDRLAASAVLRREPASSAMFLRYMLIRNIRIEEHLVDHLFNSIEKRLARVLLLLADFGKKRKPKTVIPKIGQETLAEIIGTTRARVSFFLNKFRKLGFITSNGLFEVHSTLLNVVLRD
jgi:CRP-like cAMP-binding protein